MHEPIRNVLSMKFKNMQFHFSVHDFMDGLEHYNSVEFQNDYQHLQLQYRGFVSS